MFGCTISGVDPLENLIKLRDSLRVLYSDKLFITKNDFARIQEFSRLEELKLKEWITLDNLITIVRELPCLKVMDFGINGLDKERGRWKELAKTLSAVKTLRLEYINISDNLVEELYKLANLTCLKIAIVGSNRTICPGVKVTLPRCTPRLRILSLRGRYVCLVVTAESDKKQGDNNFANNIEELEISSIGEMPKNAFGDITERVGLKTLLLMSHIGVFLRAKHSKIRKTQALRRLSLVGIVLTPEDLSYFLRSKHLRSLSFRYTAFTDSIIKSIAKLESLEMLALQSHSSNAAMNPILNMKNLRMLEANRITTEYDDVGDFASIKGFEKLQYDEFTMLSNDGFYKFAKNNCGSILRFIKGEASLNNWKGITTLGFYGVNLDSVFTLAISPHLVFVEEINLNLQTSLIYYDTTENIRGALSNCVMLKKLVWCGCTIKSTPVDVAMDMLQNKPLLRSLVLSVDKLNGDFAKALAKCQHLETIGIHVNENSDNFFNTLFVEESLEGCMLQNIQLQYNNSRKFCNCATSYILDRVDREEIIKIIGKKDASEIFKYKRNLFLVDLMFIGASSPVHTNQLFKALILRVQRRDGIAYL